MAQVHEETTRAAAGPLSRPYLEVTVAVLALVTIVAFESMAVSTAMPDVARELDAVRSYGFAFSVMLTAQLLGIVLAGVWSDRSGPLPGAFVGQVLLAVGSATCGVAERFDVFLVGRALTGLGGGLLVVMLYVIAGRVYPEVIRPRLFTYVSAAWVLPALAGPPVSAWVTEHLSWRWVFLGVVAPVLVTVLALRRAQQRTDTARLREVVSSRDHRTHVRTAWAGVAVALAAGALQFGSHELDLELSAKTVVGLVGLVGVAVVAPVLLPRATWAMGRGLPSVILARALLCAAFYGGITYVPLFLVGQRGASLQVAGLALAVGAIGWAVGAWYQGHDVLHLPRYRLVEVGGVFLAVGAGVARLRRLGGPPRLAQRPRPVPRRDRDGHRRDDDDGRGARAEPGARPRRGLLRAPALGRPRQRAGDRGGDGRVRGAPRARSGQPVVRRDLPRARSRGGRRRPGGSAHQDVTAGRGEPRPPVRVEHPDRSARREEPQ